jgi:hypothetical protein
MASIEYHIDVIDLTEETGRSDIETILEQLRETGDDGWELVSATLNASLPGHDRSHVLVYKRSLSARSSSSSS